MNRSTQVNSYINSHSGWKKTNLEIFRQAVHTVEPEIIEDFKWGVPVYLFNGKMVCASSVMKEYTKYNFFDGAKISDKDKLFTSGFEAKRHRGIDLREGESIDEKKLENLIQEAINIVR